MAHFRGTLADARETATLAPVRWRARAPMALYLDAAPHLDHALRNSRVLARRTVGLLRDGEQAPPRLVAAVIALVEVVRTLSRELARGEEPVRARELAGAAVTLATDAYRGGLGFHGNVVVAQVRSIGTDLLLASGLEQRMVERLVRHAAGRTAPRSGGADGRTTPRSGGADGH